MPYTFSPPSFATGEVFAPGMDEASRRLFGHFAPHRRGYTVRKVGDTYVQTTEAYSEDLTSADVLYMGGHTYVVSDDEAADLIAAGYGDNVASALLSEAVVLLRASALPEGYTPGQDWPNEGTGGSGYDAIATGEPELDTEYDGAGFVIGGPEHIGPYFHVQDGPAINVGTGSLTAFAMVRWIEETDAIGNVMSKIAGLMGTDGHGWQIMDIIDFEGFDLGATAIIGDGGSTPGVNPAFAVDPAGQLSLGEHLLVIRVDRGPNELSLFVDAAAVATVDASDVPNTDVEHEWIFGRSSFSHQQIGRAYGFFDRALTDDEISERLPAELGFS